MRRTFVSMEKQEWDKEPNVNALMHATTLDFPEAESAYLDIIGKGSILSMANLGSQYEFRPNSYGGPDLVEAEVWYRKSIDAGSAVATLPVGYFYLRQKNYKRAFEIFSIGTERGYPPSMVRLAHLYANGRGVEQSIMQAEILLKRASKLKNIRAKMGLAELYMKTEGNCLKVARGIFLIFIAAIQFHLERRFNPESERLKK